MYIIYMLPVFLIPKFHSTLLYDQPFILDTGHFQISALNDPQNHLEHSIPKLEH